MLVSTIVVASAVTVCEMIDVDVIARGVSVTRISDVFVMVTNA